MIKKTAVAALLLFAGWSAIACAAERLNVLFIAVDDLNDWVEPLQGHPQVKTPNFARLAARGTNFTNAHCQAPLCNPSRSSLLTGRRPTSTGIYGLAPGIREVDLTKSAVTLPQTFTSAGYYTYTCGKIYHDGSMRKKDQTAEFNAWGPAPGTARPPTLLAKLPPPHHPAMDWGAFPANEKDAGDYKIATAAIDALKNAPTEKPFFIAAGFRLPHVPLYAPQKWFDLYPDDKLIMPPVKPDERAGTPMFSWFLHWKLPEPRLSVLKKMDEWRPLVRAYLASVSFMDAQVGRLLDALDESGRSKNTIVILWSDHGWHLGEKMITGKNTLWERSTHVPFIWAGPGIAANVSCKRTVELIDTFPTLTEMCVLPKPDGLEGHSLMPLLKDATAAREWPALTSHNQGNHAVRTEQWRYIRYADGSEELYDMINDPKEWTNLAADAKFAGVKIDLSKWFPKTDLPPAPNSSQRVLTYDPKTGKATWEGKVIVEDEIEK